MSAEREGRTEEPTGKQRKKFREEGQVAKSSEINTLAQYVAGLLVLSFFGPMLIDRLMGTAARTMTALAEQGVTSTPIGTLQELGLHVIMILLPIFIFLWVAVFATNVAQFGFIISWKALQPKAQKFNIFSNFKNQFMSTKSLVELAKSLTKITILTILIIKVTKGLTDVYPQLFYLSPQQSALFIWDVVMDIWWVFIFFMIALGFVDGWYQRHQLNEKMKMTPSQVKDEHKQAEGDPQIKRKIRSKQFSFIQELMKKNIEGADVVITNPTHFAVALSYKHGTMTVPKVVAKGVDHVALTLRRIARDKNIPIVENRRIARSLYYTTPIDGEIPEEFYRPVAEILAFVFQINRKQRRAS